MNFEIQRFGGKGGGDTTVKNEMSPEQREFYGIAADYARAIAPNAKFLNTWGRDLVDKAIREQVDAFDYKSLGNTAIDRANESFQGLDKLLGSNQQAAKQLRDQLNLWTGELGGYAKTNYDNLGDYQDSLGSAMSKSNSLLGGLATNVGTAVGNANTNIGGYSSKFNTAANTANKSINTAQKSNDTLTSDYQDSIKRLAGGENTSANNAIGGLNGLNTSNSNAATLANDFLGGKNGKGGFVSQTQNAAKNFNTDLGSYNGYYWDSLTDKEYDMGEYSQAILDAAGTVDKGYKTLEGNNNTALNKADSLLGTGEGSYYDNYNTAQGAYASLLGNFANAAGNSTLAGSSPYYINQVDNLANSTLNGYAANAQDFTDYNDTIRSGLNTATKDARDALDTLASTDISGAVSNADDNYVSLYSDAFNGASKAMDELEGNRLDYADDSYIKDLDTINSGLQGNATTAADNIREYSGNMRTAANNQDTLLSGYMSDTLNPATESAISNFGGLAGGMSGAETLASDRFDTLYSNASTYGEAAVESLGGIDYSDVYKDYYDRLETVTGGLDDAASSIRSALDSISGDFSSIASDQATSIGSGLGTLQADLGTYLTDTGNRITANDSLVTDTGTDFDNYLNDISTLVTNANSDTNSRIKNNDTLASDMYNYALSAANNATSTATQNNDDLSKYIASNIAGLSDSKNDLSDLRQGNISQQYLNAMQDAIRSSMTNTIGQNLNSLGQRGVLNSSVTTQALNDIEKNASDAVAQNYLKNIELLQSLSNDQFSNTITTNHENAEMTRTKQDITDDAQDKAFAYRQTGYEDMANNSKTNAELEDRQYQRSLNENNTGLDLTQRKFDNAKSVSDSNATLEKEKLSATEDYAKLITQMAGQDYSGKTQALQNQADVLGQSYNVASDYTKLASQNEQSLNSANMSASSATENNIMNQQGIRNQYINQQADIASRNFDTSARNAQIQQGLFGDQLGAAQNYTTTGAALAGQSAQAKMQANQGSIAAEVQAYNAQSNAANLASQNMQARSSDQLQRLQAQDANSTNQYNISNQNIAQQSDITGQRFNTNMQGVQQKQSIYNDELDASRQYANTTANLNQNNYSARNTATDKLIGTQDSIYNAGVSGRQEQAGYAQNKYASATDLASFGNQNAQQSFQNANTTSQLNQGLLGDRFNTAQSANQNAIQTAQAQNQMWADYANYGANTSQMGYNATQQGIQNAANFTQQQYANTTNSNQLNANNYNNAYSIGNQSANTQASLYGQGYNAGYQNNLQKMNNAQTKLGNTNNAYTQEIGVQNNLLGNSLQGVNTQQGIYGQQFNQYNTGINNMANMSNQQYNTALNTYNQYGNWAQNIYSGDMGANAANTGIYQNAIAQSGVPIQNAAAAQEGAMYLPSQAWNISLGMGNQNLGAMSAMSRYGTTTQSGGNFWTGFGGGLLGAGVGLLG